MIPPLVVHLVNGCYLVYGEGTGTIPKGYKTVENMAENVASRLKNQSQFTVIMRGFNGDDSKGKVIDALSNVPNVSTIHVEKN